MVLNTPLILSKKYLPGVVEFSNL